MVRSSRRGSRSIVVAFLLAIATVAHADPIKCERAIAEASAKFTESKAKLLQDCEDRKTTSDLLTSVDCRTEPKTAAGIEKAAGKVALSIAKDCGGKDKTCGTSDDDPLLSIGWGAVAACPNFESGSCNGPIADCNGIVDCLTCVDETAVDQAISLYYADLANEEFGTNSAVNKCQRAIGKETVKFLRAKSKALQKCWDARLKGKHSNACPTPGDGKAGPSIDQAETKKVEAICKACGGPDKACGGGDDLDPSAIGFAADCPDVTVPGAASSCAGPIADLQDVVVCVDCVTEFKVDCMDRLAVPEFGPYPPECLGTSTTTTTTSTTTSTTAGELCGNGVVDPTEPCDPSSPGGVFLCAPGEVCTAACTCASTTTTSTEAPTTSTTSTSSTTTSTTAPELCGNGMVDPTEPCDPSSPGGVFLCAPGEVCTAACTCASTTTTSTEAPTTTEPAPTTSTSTTEEPSTSSTSSSSSSTTEAPATSSTTTTIPPYGSPSRAFLVAPRDLLE